MSNVQFYLQAIKEQINKVEKLTFRDIIKQNFEEQKEQDIEEAYEYYKNGIIKSK